MGKSAPKPPDLKPIANAQLKIADQMNATALKQLGLSEQQFAYMKEQGQAELAFAKEQADKNIALQERALAAGEAAQLDQSQLTEAQKRLMEQAYDYSLEDRERYRDVAIPFQDKILAEAQGWDSPERQAQMAAEAQADVQRQADAQRRNVDAQLSGMGIDPSQMRAGAIANTLGLQTAAMGAMQGNNARQQVQQQGIAMRGNAANILAGLPAQGAQQQGIASNNAGQASNMIAQGQNSQLAGINTYSALGQTAAGLRSNALNNYSNWTGSPTQWAGMSNQGMGMASNSIMNAGNVLTQGYQNRLAQFNAQAGATSGMLSGLGAVAGGFASFAEGGDVKGVPRKRIPKSGETTVRDFENKIEAPAGSALKRAPVWQDRASAVGDALTAAAGAGGDYIPDELENNIRATYYAEGGKSGGALPARQSQDQIPAMLSHGEYIVPADVVRAKGVEFFDNLTKKYHRVGT